MRRPSIQARRYKATLSLGACAMAMLASPAFANCSPDSIAVVGTVTCAEDDGSSNTEVAAIAPLANGINPGLLIEEGNFDNSANLIVRGNAVEVGSIYEFSPVVITNQGLIKSTGGIAVLGLPVFDTFELYNESSGVIQGGAGSPAIRVATGADITNRGLIVGDVEIGTEENPYPYIFASSFVNDGGVVRGDVIFRKNYQGIFLQYSGEIRGSIIFDDSAGVAQFEGGTVSGIVDGGDGDDSLFMATSFAKDGILDLAQFKNFETIFFYGDARARIVNSPDLFNILMWGANLEIPLGEDVLLRHGFLLDFGQLELNGTLRILNEIGMELPGNVIGSILSGNGTIQTERLNVTSGFVVPGGENKVGRLTFEGNLFLEGGAVVIADVGRNSSDRLVVSALSSGIGGNFNIVDASLALVANGPGPRFGQTYTLATGNISGQFSDVQGSFGVLTPELTYNPDSITLRFNAGSLAAALPADAKSAELAFASALDSLRNRHYGSLFNLYGAVDLMDPVSRGLTLRGLVPTGINETVGLGLVQNGMATRLVSDRLSSLGTETSRRGRFTLMGSPIGLPGGERLASSTATAALSSFAANLTSGQTVAGRLPEHMSGFVSMGFGEGKSSLTEAFLPNGQSGRRTWHMAMGLEVGVTDDTTLGTAFAYVEGDSRASGNQTGVRTSQAIVYGNHQLGNGGYLAGLAAMALNRFDSSRLTSDSQSLQRLNGTANAMSAEARVEAGWNLAVAKGLTLTPAIGLSATHIRLGDLREGGGGLALQISDVRDQRIEASAGLRLAGSFQIGQEWSFAPQLELRYGGRIAAGGRTMSLRFDAADSVAFQLPLDEVAGQRIEAKGGFRLTNDWLAISAGFETVNGGDPWRESRAVAAISVGF